MAGPGGGLPQKEREQGLRRDRDISGIQAGLLIQLLLRDTGKVAVPPGRLVVGQPAQELAVGVEHVIEQAGREKILHRVPGENQRAVFLQHLVVEPDLRCLGHAVDDLAEGSQRGEGRPETLRRQVEHAGEDDGHKRPGRRVLRACQFAQDPDAADVAVFQASPQFSLHRGAVLRERPARSRRGRHQDQRGEVAQDTVHLRMQGQPVEQGDVEGEGVVAAPAAKHVGIGGEQDGRRGEARLGSPRLQPLPRAGFQRGAATAKPGARSGAACPCDRQHGRGRKRGNPVPPVLNRLLVSLAIALRDLAEHVVPVGQLQRRKVSSVVPVQPHPLVDQYHQAAAIDVQQVDADVHSGAAAVQERGPDLESRPGFRREDLMREFLARRGQSAGQQIRTLVTRIGDLHLIPGHRGQDPLAAVGQDDGPQHVVPGNHPVPALFQAPQVDAVALDLDVGVDGDIADLVGGAAPDPVRLLDFGQRERVTTPGQVRLDGGEGGRPGTLRAVAVLLAHQAQQEVLLLPIRPGASPVANRYHVMTPVR